jgi:uncharacterized surface protein with fasciclin (FAS1) repeats
MKKKTISPFWLSLVAVAGSLGAGLSAESSVVEFTPQEARSLEWRVVDDGVMGGLSKGNLEVSEEGILTFFGKLSLENNGGFSSIRTERFGKDLSDADGVVARVLGDGRTYQLRFYTDARFRGMSVSFKSEFQTKKGEWTEVKIPFESFVGSFRGRLLEDQKFDPAKIERLGLLLADKNAGDFRLKVDWLRTYQETSDDLVSTALADGRFGTLAKALTEADLVGTLQGDGPFTVFAPTDEAFAKLPEGALESLLQPENRERLKAVLTYHVVSGLVGLPEALTAGKAGTVNGEPLGISFAEGRVRINQAVLLNADLKCANGIIHVIDSVLLPPEPANDLVSVATRDGRFKTLLAAVKAADLEPLISGDGPLTIFAPTDEAFAALPDGTVDSLLKEENKTKLQAILALHAVRGAVSAGDALNAGSAKSLGEETLSFGIEDGVFKVNGATIKTTDVMCDNGVIHVIDRVLLPAKTGKTSSLSPAKQIEEAIDRGVPAFNNGNPGECAKIYRTCMMAIAQDDATDARVTKALEQLVARADQVGDDTERAWVLRSGLDRLYQILSEH